MSEPKSQKNEINLEGEVAIITGGGGGIGSGVAHVLHSCGAKVVISDINEAAAERTTVEIGEDALVVTGDLTKESTSQSIVDQTMARWGRIDILVNCAGNTAVSHDGLLSYSLDEWQRGVDVHLRSVVNMCQRVGKVLTEQQSGSVINISAVSSMRSMGGCATYTMSKAAIDHLTRTLAVQWGPHRVRVNCVSPGAIAAGQHKYLEAKGEGAVEAVRSSVPLGDLGSAEDVAWSVAFLASDLARYVSGVVLPVDGGFLAG